MTTPRRILTRLPRPRPVPVDKVRARLRRLSGPSGGWGGPVTVVAVGAAVAAVTALPALGIDPTAGAVDARAGIGVGTTGTADSRPDRNAGADATDAHLEGWGYRDTAGDVALDAAEGGNDLDLDLGLDFAPPSAPGQPGAVAAGTTEARSLAASGIPQVSLRAYQAAAAALAVADPACRIDWTLLAGIGRVESNHGRFAGAVVTPQGVSVPPVIGIRLDGSVPRTVVHVDTEGGRLDGDTAYDRAVGPMQFLPGSWVAFGADGDGDGVRNPQDIDDAALAAAAFLCSGRDDLSTVPGASAAVRRYNNSGEYVALVLRLADAYKGQVPLGAVPLVPPATAVPVQPLAPEQPASPPEVLGVPGASPTPTEAPVTATPSSEATSSEASTSSSPSSSSSSASSSPSSASSSSSSSSSDTASSASSTAGTTTAPSSPTGTGTGSPTQGSGSTSSSTSTAPVPPTPTATAGTGTTGTTSTTAPPTTAPTTTVTDTASGTSPADGTVPTP